jgi:hypothetical protein
MTRRYFSPPILIDSRAAASGAGGWRGPGADAASGRVPVLHRLRIPMLALLLLLLWIGLLGWAAQAPLIAVFQPEQRLHFSGSDFRVVMGAGVENGRHLGINSVGAEHMALQSISSARPIDADAVRILRYRWQDFPRTLELSFVFRRADQPEDVHTVTLPPAGAFPAFFDLANVPDWRGRIIEIGFAEFPTAQLVPADIAFRPFSLMEAELWSPSWRGSLGALATDWSAYRPWALMSVSALGPDAPWPHKATPVLLLTIGVATSLLLAAIVLARSWTWLGLTLCGALAVCWLALDLRWLGEFADRHALTRELYAGKPWRERAAIEPDIALIASAARVRELLAREPANAHVIVAADAVYDVLRLSYHLLPANVAPVGALLPLHPRATATQPALLVVYADPTWTFDQRVGTLRYADFEYAAELLFEEGDIRIFQLRGVDP